jgi:ribonuclease HII
MARLFNKTAYPLWPDLQFESSLWLAGKTIVVGIDEAGRGAWAGPVTAAAVVLPHNQPDLLNRLHGVRDSKLMTALQRDHWAEIIQESVTAYSIGWATCEEIDLLGILPSTRLAMQRAVDGLGLGVDHLLIDAVKLPAIPVGQTSLIKGDMRVLSIAAASVIAKTQRDRFMKLLEEEIPGYGFARHKGYGTRFHRESLAKLGISIQHRKSYAPVRALLENESGIE